ncbi:hypothetical protein ACIA4Q_02645 [Lactobacillus delbrueckii subsp. bulgaricus]
MEVENHMVVEGNYVMTKEAYEKIYELAYEVEDESEEAYWQYLMDQIDYIEPVRACLDACGFDSMEELAEWFRNVNTEDLRDLLDNLETYDKNIGRSKKEGGL